MGNYVQSVSISNFTQDGEGVYQITISLDSSYIELEIKADDSYKTVVKKLQKVVDEEKEKNRPRIEMARAQVKMFEEKGAETTIDCLAYKSIISQLSIDDD